MPDMSFAMRPIAVVLTAAVLCVSTGAVAQERAIDAAPSAVPPGDGPLRASARRAAAAEPLRNPSDPQSRPAPACDCRASMAEKIAWLYALVGGSIMLVTGPAEKEGDVWTVDGKSETAAGAAAVVLSFYLLKDIRKKRAAAAAP
jgi:hypothetical protein